MFTLSEHTVYQINEYLNLSIFKFKTQKSLNYTITIRNHEKDSHKGNKKRSSRIRICNKRRYRIGLERKRNNV